MPGLKGQILFIVLMMGCSLTRPMIKMYSKPKVPEESFLPWKKGHRDSAWSMWPNASYLHPPCDLGWKKEHRRSVHPARTTPWKHTPSKPEPRRECIWRPIAVDSSKLQQHGVPKRLHGERWSSQRSPTNWQRRTLVRCWIPNGIECPSISCSYLDNQVYITVSHQRTHGKPGKHMYDPILSQWLGFFGYYQVTLHHRSASKCAPAVTSLGDWSLDQKQLIAKDF